MIIVIVGPRATGKTRHGRSFAEHYGCGRVVEDGSRSARFMPRDGDLLLSDRNRHDAGRRFPSALVVGINEARRAIGLEPAPVGGFAS